MSDQPKAAFRLEAKRGLDALPQYLAEQIARVRAGGSAFDARITIDRDGAMIRPVFDAPETLRADQSAIYAFAMIAGYALGKETGEKETQIGARFRGSLGALREMGLPRRPIEEVVTGLDMVTRMLESGFISGYAEQIKDKRIFTNDEGRIVDPEK